MNKLELSSLQYPPLEKLANLANKAQKDEVGVEQLLQILPQYEAIVNAKIKEIMEQNLNTPSYSSEKINNANRALFTDKTGPAWNAVMEQQAKMVNKQVNSKQTANSGYER